MTFKSVGMAENIHNFNEQPIQKEDTKDVNMNTKSLYFEVPHENLTVFTCLIDMIALEEGVFGSGTSHSRIARAHRNLQHGLQLKDGSIFRYTHASGPSLDDEDKMCRDKDINERQETKNSSN